MTRQTIAVIAAALLVAVTAHAQGRHEYTQTTSQTLSAQDVERIVATTPDGEIEVRPGDGSEVKLEITKRVRTRRGSDVADRNFDEMTIDISTVNRELSIIGDIPDYRPGVSLSIDYTMQVPEGMHLNLRTSDGSVDVRDIGGHLQARTSDGDIVAIDTAGVELRTSDGEIEVESVEGDVSATTSDGTITIATVTGNAYARSSDGDITCDNVRGSVEIQLSDGDATIRGVHNGVTARTSDGELDIAEVNGPVELKTSDGDILLALADSAETDRITCTTSDGNIRVEVMKTAAYSIEARTSDGRVNVELPGEFDWDERHKRVQGRINGGGPKLSLRASDGSITVADRTR